LRPRSILKSSSLPALERPPSSMMFSGGLPPGAASFQNLPETTAYRTNLGTLPSVNEVRPGTSQCNNWLESSMGFRMGVPPPPRRGSPQRRGASNAISVGSRPRTGMNDPMNVSTGLQQWDPRTAARARMGSLKHFTATPPRPVSRERRQPLPSLTYMGIHGGQVRHADDWNYKFGHTLDKRVRHDHVAGDLGHS
jgi:hypothetical protein